MICILTMKIQKLPCLTEVVLISQIFWQNGACINSDEKLKNSEMSNLM